MFVTNFLMQDHVDSPCQAIQSVVELDLLQAIIQGHLKLTDEFSHLATKLSLTTTILLKVFEEVSVFIRIDQVALPLGIKSNCAHLAQIEVDVGYLLVFSLDLDLLLDQVHQDLFKVVDLDQACGYRIIFAPRFGKGGQTLFINSDLLLKARLSEALENDGNEEIQEHERHHHDEAEEKENRR